MIGVDLDAETAQGFEILARNSGASVLACFVALAGRALCRRFDRKELLLGVPMGLRETQDEFCAAGFYVNTVPLRVRLDGLDDSAAVADAARQMRQAIEHSRYCAADIVPEFLATHAHFEPVGVPGLELNRLELELRASKLTASFTLVTGTASRIVLEYDAGCIADAPALLDDLAQSMRRACEGLARRNPRQVLADAWREILHPGSASSVQEESDFFRDGGDSIKAIQITGILRRSGITALSAPDFLRKPHFGDLCTLLESADSELSAAQAMDYSPVAPGEQVPLLPFARYFLGAHPSHWRQFFMSLLDCLGWIGGAAPLSLHDLRWRKPVTCGPGRRVVLLAQEQGDALAVELHHFEPATHNVGGVSTTGQTTGTWSVAASGLVRGGTARPAALNLATARESLREMAQQDTPEDSPLM